MMAPKLQQNGFVPATAQRYYPRLLCCQARGKRTNLALPGHDRKTPGRSRKTWLRPNAVPRVSAALAPLPISCTKWCNGTSPTQQFSAFQTSSSKFLCCSSSIIRSNKHHIGIEVAKKNPHVKYQYRSLLDEPSITVTGPAGQGEKTKHSKASSIHPATSFDDGPPSGARTPMDSDTEADLTDIRRAQKLSLFQTPIKDTPNAARALRIIYRGDWRKVAQEAKEEQRTLRKYIVASDLSDESTHALEWAVGTVLRDGDTMICLYCVDEEAGIAPADDAKSIKDQGAALNVVADSKAPVTPGGSSLDLHKADQSSESLATPLKSKAEEERHRAVQDITDRVEKLLRKTKLQVRVIVEVLHCKNPKHQILEIIDVVNPTLVVLGSRGQSALKG